MKIWFALLTQVLALNVAFASSAKSNYIRGFGFTSCGAKNCIQIRSKGAFVSLMSGSFSTDGETELSIFDRAGRLLSKTLGSEANFNPSIDTVSLQSETGFSIYTLKDEKLETYKTSGRAMNAAEQK